MNRSYIKLSYFILISYFSLNEVLASGLMRRQSDGSIHNFRVFKHCEEHRSADFANEFLSASFARKPSLDEIKEKFAVEKNRTLTQRKSLKDWYSFAGITLSFKLDKRNDCPPY